MNLMQRIRSDQVKARKQKDKTTATLLTTLLGEASMVGKNDGNRETTDAEVVAMLKKFIKNIDETIKVSADTDELQTEKKVLEAYLPTQMSESELREKITQFVDGKQGLNIGTVMKFLKENHAGQYDGKSASTIAKEVLFK